MIGTSLPEYVFIRVCVFVLHHFALLLLATLLLTLIIDHQAHRLTLLLEILAVAEVIFYVLVYIPRSRALQAPASHPTLLSREDRRKLFHQAHQTIADGEGYLSKWFCKAPLADIRRENVKEFFCWAFLNRRHYGPADEEELDEYTDKLEEFLGRRLEPGRGAAKALLLTLDPVNMLHRPLLWYFIVAIVDTITYLRLQFHGFRFYRLAWSRLFSVFPFRVLALTSRHKTPSSTLTYWYRPHTSPTRRPVLFVHGIGIGLWTYASFLAAINGATEDGVDGQIGIIAVELMPISFRITGEIPDQHVLCEDILKILKAHGWDKCVLATHSYGSVVAANLIKNPLTSGRIGSLMLVDPVAFLLNTPDVAYNFTRRAPRRANEHQLYYFASTDMGVAHTLARHFFWLQNILWKEDLRNRNATVTLSGRDLIVDTRAVGRYLTEDGTDGGYERFLTEDESGTAEEDNWRDRGWKGEGLDVLWFEKCDHAQVFDGKGDYMRLVHVLRAYCAEA